MPGGAAAEPAVALLLASGATVSCRSSVAGNGRKRCVDAAGDDGELWPPGGSANKAAVLGDAALLLIAGVAVRSTGRCGGGDAADAWRKYLAFGTGS